MPHDVEAIRMSLEAYRNCREDAPSECYQPQVDDPWNVYPQTKLFVVDPSGVTHPPAVAVANEGNLGRAELEVDPGPWRGHAWRMYVKAFGDYPDPLLQKYSGLVVSVTLGEDLPPYLSWLEKERLVLPFATPFWPRMVHQVETPYDFTWQVVPAGQICFAAAWDCLDEGGPCEGESYLPGQRLWRHILPGGQILKQRHHASLRTWLLSYGGDLRTRLDTLDAIPRPIGLTQDARLRTSDEGIPGPPRAFVSLGRATQWCGWVVEENDPGVAQLHEAIERCFRTVAPQEQVSHEDTDIFSWAYQLGLHRRSAITHDCWWNPVPPPDMDGFGSAFDDGAIKLSDTNGVLSATLIDGPLQIFGHDSGWLREMASHLRLYDPRHPSSWNDEPGIVAMREMRNFLELWGDEENLLWPENEGGNTPPCKLAARWWRSARRRPRAWRSRSPSSSAMRSIRMVR